MEDTNPRVGKLRELVRSAGKIADFARNYSQEGADKPIDPTYISQLLNGHRNFGEKAARNLERRAGLPHRFFEPDETDVPSQEVGHDTKLVRMHPRRLDYDRLCTLAAKIDRTGLATLIEFAKVILKTHPVAKAKSRKS